MEFGENDRQDQRSTEERFRYQSDDEYGSDHLMMGAASIDRHLDFAGLILIGADYK